MAADIVERLRVDCECYDGDTCVHAAARDEIVRLRAEYADLLEVYNTVWKKLEARRER